MKLIAIVYFVYGTLLISFAYYFSQYHIFVFITASMVAVFSFVVSAIYSMSDMHKHLMKELKVHKQCCDNWEANANHWRDEYHSLRNADTNE